MSVVADQVEYFKKQSRNNLIITISSKADSQLWVQISIIHFNVAYPFADPPLTTIQKYGVSVPEEIEVIEWKAYRFATFRHGWEVNSALTMFLSDYLQKVLQVPDTQESVSVLYSHL